LQRRPDTRDLKNVQKNDTESVKEFLQKGAKVAKDESSADTESRAKPRFRSYLVDAMVLVRLPDHSNLTR